MNGARPAHADHFSELIVYQKSRTLARRIFELSSTFPREEAYSLTDQVRRSSRSIGAQIAEAWAKRSYERSFLSKLADANGELYETQHWIDVAADCRYITPETRSQLYDQCREIGRLLGGMVAKANLFCRPDHTFSRRTVQITFHPATTPLRKMSDRRPRTFHCSLFTVHLL